MTMPTSSTQPPDDHTSLIGPETRKSGEIKVLAPFTGRLSETTRAEEDDPSFIPFSEGGSPSGAHTAVARLDLLPAPMPLPTPTVTVNDLLVTMGFGLQGRVPDSMLRQVQGAQSVRQVIRLPVQPLIDQLSGLLGTSGDDTIIGTLLRDIIRGLGGNDTLGGSLGDDTLIGGIGNDVYIVLTGNETLQEEAGQGTDTVIAHVNNFILQAFFENLRLVGPNALRGVGNSQNNTLWGNTLGNTLEGLAGNDVLDGDAGVDTLIGGIGNDIYKVDEREDLIIESAVEGVDQVHADALISLGANIENVTLTGTSALHAIGNSLDNLIEGNIYDNSLMGGDGNDTLIGGQGNDTLIGGLGDDTYVVSQDVSWNSHDRVHEGVNEGTDTAIFINNVADDFSLAENVEIGRLGLAYDGSIFGNSGNNTLYGNVGNDYLDGELGLDTLIGGRGNDTYDLVNYGTTIEVPDVVVELANEGIDTVYVNQTYTLPDNVENLSIYNLSDLTTQIHGNALNNVIESGSLYHTSSHTVTFQGLQGADTYRFLGVLAN